MNSLAISQDHKSGAALSPKVLAAAASGVEDMIARFGGDIDAIFGRATLRTDELSSPINELSLQQYCALFEEAASQTGQDNFGLRFGQDFAPQRLGAIGYAAIASPTLGAGLRNLNHYFPAHQDSSLLGLEEEGDLLWLTYQIVDPRIERRRQDAELSLGMFCNVLRAALGPDWRPLEIHFEHRKPDAPGEHERRFGAPARFSQRTNAIGFRRSALAAPMPGCDPYLFALIEPFLAERQAARGGPGDLIATLRQEIKLRLGEGSTSLGTLAKRMGISTAALQRQLREAGVAYNDLLRATRQELALRYVRETDMPLTEIALAVGYSELSAFSRAFRAWTGLSPQRFRREAARDAG
ncbi:MAG: AraC family transcriptional regulator [Rhodospirillales bacterium]